MWKKRKAIEGVSASSMVALKATLFEEEQRSKLQGKAQPTEKKAKVKSLRDALGVSNKGLAERLARDEQQKAPADMTPEDIERRLREKAELYHRIKRGEVDVNDDDDERGYLVDFVKKGYLEQEEEDSRDRRGPDGSLPLYMQSEDVRREQDRQAWERSVQQEAEADQRKRQGIAVVEQIREQTLRGRAKAEELKRRRERMMEQRLQRIKASVEGRGGEAGAEGKTAAEAEEEEEDGSDESSVAEPYDPFDEGDEDDDAAKPAAAK